jgi:hypothetical protein
MEAFVGILSRMPVSVFCFTQAILLAEIRDLFAGVHPVIPAKAGIQLRNHRTKASSVRIVFFWIPACAGMTKEEVLTCITLLCMS